MKRQLEILNNPESNNVVPIESPKPIRFNREDNSEYWSKCILLLIVCKTYNNNNDINNNDNKFTDTILAMMRRDQATLQCLERDIIAFGELTSYVHKEMSRQLAHNKSFMCFKRYTQQKQLSSWIAMCQIDALIVSVNTLYLNREFAKASRGLYTPTMKLHQLSTTRTSICDMCQKYKKMRKELTDIIKDVIMIKKHQPPSENLLESP